MHVYRLVKFVFLVPARLRWEDCSVTAMFNILKAFSSGNPLGSPDEEGALLHSLKDCYERVMYLDC